MKKLNIKALLIDHVEKFVFGLFALIVLGVLLGGTTWARYAKTPDEIKRSVANVRAKIAANSVWPKEKEASFSPVDYTEKARTLFSMPSLVRYDFSQWLFHPLYRKNEPKREPVYEAVQNLIAKAALVPLSVLSEEARQMMESQPAEGDGVAATADMPAGNDEFEVRTNAAGNNRLPGDGLPVGRMPAMPGGPGGGHAASMPKTSGGPKSGAPAGGHAGGGKGGRPGMLGLPANPGETAGALGMAMPGMPGMPGEMGAGMNMGATAGATARGVRMIAVRGVFPVRKQIENYRNALHVTQAEAEDMLEITDFILERQSAQAGADPWKDSKWVTVDIQSAVDVLNECSDLDFEDPVPTAIRDAVITMDLPLILLGLWKDYATHPRIKDEELSPEAMEAENKLLETLSETVDGTKLGEAPPVRRKGLAVAQRDFKGLVNQVKSNPEGRNMMDDMMKKMSASSSSMPRAPGMGPSSGPAMPGSMMMGGAMRGVAAIDRLVARKKFLLFRYFDFDVESGMAYRYRVRLKLRNPNFDLPAEELAGADMEISKGEERETPWSNTSNPDFVRATSNYFLKDVEREPYLEDKVKATTRPVAALSMYDWDTKLGAVFSDVLNLTAIGGFISEVKKGTMVPDLVAGTLEKGEHTFVTQDVLIDVDSDVDVSPDQHPDLKLTTEKGHITAKLGLLEEALVVTGRGELRTLGNPIGDIEKDDLKYWKQREDFEHKIIKAKETSTTRGLAGTMGAMGTMGADGLPVGPMKNPRRGRRGGMPASSSMPPSSGSMMPGMGLPPGGGSSGGSSGSMPPSSRGGSRGSSRGG